MAGSEVHAVTGAFGFSGKYIAKRLLDAGHQVITITNSPYRENPFEGKVKAYTFNFDNTEKLTDTLKGTAILYNNYWIRFNYNDFNYSMAVENSLKLLEAAKKAGIRRIVHISIANPSENSPYEYFRGKAEVERALIKSGISYAILRPAVIFGKEDVLINNIAWFLRRFPVFGVFGDGSYRLQPIYVDDLAKLAVKKGEEKENSIIDAIGPETFTYRGMVEMIGNIVGKRRPIISIPPFLGYLLGSLVSLLVGDVTITQEEIEGLMAGLLYTDSPPAGKTKLTNWAKENAESLGVRYASELARRRNRTTSYEKL